MPQNCKLLYNFGRYSKTKNFTQDFSFRKAGTMEQLSSEDLFQ